MLQFRIFHQKMINIGYELANVTVLENQIRFLSIRFTRKLFLSLCVVVVLQSFIYYL